MKKQLRLSRKKREAEKNRIISTFGENAEYQVLNGRFGPYFTFGGNNYKIPKGTDPKSLDAEKCKALIAQQGTPENKKKAYSKKKK